MTRFTSILIANRGEIACRIARTARSLGYRTVAVYTDADARSPHVALADDAVRIGAGPVAESYLATDSILAAAARSGAQAVHPGYGFLSENGAFARACEAAGLVFIGPSAAAIDAMGDKARAKRHMHKAGVPCVPGYEGENQDAAVLVSEAERIGLPVMIKAAAGGGGRGMRHVTQAAELPGAIERARAEARAAFGSDALIVEKALVRARHVEVQVMADEKGHTISLGERDCSVQRRHQKVIEEAPCPVVGAPLREALGAAAVAAAKSIGYCGAGTVEFLLDEDGAFYFLEMNTRLQVEHPVTESITRLDLVALQIQVAQGEPLGIAQEAVQFDGHAIEARLYAEDPARDFLPQSGTIALWSPAGGDGVRVDAGVCTGLDVAPFYDPLLAKIIAHGPTREAARRRLVAALGNTAVFGVNTNRAFLTSALERKTFVAGAATTGFIAEEFDTAQLAATAPTLRAAAVAAVLDLTHGHRRARRAAVATSPELDHWCSAGTLVSHRRYRFADVEYDLAVTGSPGGGGRANFLVADAVSALRVTLLRVDEHAAEVMLDEGTFDVRYLALDAGRIYLLFDGCCHLFEDGAGPAVDNEEGAGGGRVTAPMHGVLAQVRVTVGQRVTAGQSLLVIEAMKMQHDVRAAQSGEVIAVHATPGAQIAADDALIDIAADA